MLLYHSGLIASVRKMKSPGRGSIPGIFSILYLTMNWNHFRTLLLISVLGNPGVLQAKSYYLSVKGNDLNKGNHWFVPFRSFEKAQAVLLPGDTLHIMNGEYYTSKPYQLEINHQGESGKWIVYKNYLNHKPQIYSGTMGVFSISSSQYISIEGLHLILKQDAFENESLPQCGIQIQGRYESPSSHIKIYNCFIKNFNGPAIKLSQYDDITISYNKFFNNAWSPLATAVIACSDAIETTQHGSYHLYIQANVLEKNSVAKDGSPSICHPLFYFDYRNAHLQSADRHALIHNNILYMNHGSSMFFESVAGFYVIHNTLYKNAQASNCSMADLQFKNSTQCKVVNNILFTPSAKPATRIENSHTTLFSNNLYYNHSYREPGLNELVGNPEFERIDENLNEYNFRLNANSPAINSGSDEYLSDIDFEGNPRKFDTHTDMGALEYRQRLMPSLKDIKAGAQPKKIKTNWSSLYLQDQKVYTLWNQSDSSFLVKVFDPFGKLVLDDRSMQDQTSSFECSFEKFPDGIYTIIAFNANNRYLERVKVISKRAKPL